MGTDKNIKLHIVTDIKEIINNTLTSFMMLKLFIILVVSIAVASAVVHDGYFCALNKGDGRGGEELYLKEVKDADNCEKACISLKKYSNAINGVTIQPCDSCGDRKAYCWCEMGMNSITSSTKYRTCYL